MPAEKSYFGFILSHTMEDIGKDTMDKDKMGKNSTAWFAIALRPTMFGIFDAFPDEAGRDAHLSGKVAAALMEKAPDLLAKTPNIDKLDVLADKLPG